MKYADMWTENFWLSFLVLIFIAGVSSYYAKSKGRNPTNWFLIGLLLGIFAPLLIWALPAVEKEQTNIKPIKPQIEPWKFDGKQWYYLDVDHHQIGPVGFEGLAAAWKEQRISPDSFVWSEGMVDWKKIEAVEGLVAHLWGEEHIN